MLNSAIDFGGAACYLDSERFQLAHLGDLSYTAPATIEKPTPPDPMVKNWPNTLCIPEPIPTQHPVMTGTSCSVGFALYFGNYLKI